VIDPTNPANILTLGKDEFEDLSAKAKLAGGKLRFITRPGNVRPMLREHRKPSILNELSGAQRGRLRVLRVSVPAAFHRKNLIGHAHMLRPQILACIALFTIAMLGVRFLAHGIVDNFGTIGALVTVGAMYAAGAWYDRRQRERP
jgi:hypothetical protein